MGRDRCCCPFCENEYTRKRKIRPVLASIEGRDGAIELRKCGCLFVSVSMKVEFGLRERSTCTQD